MCCCLNLRWWAAIFWEQYGLRRFALLLLLLLLCRAGLDVLLSDLSVVGCHRTTWAAKYHSELGAAAAMFKAGYSIDSLLMR
jgi:hypothetical protein